MRTPPATVWGAWVLLTGAGVTSAATTALADSPEPVRAAVQCERGSGPGRIRCEASVRVEPGLTIQWADVQIVGAPAFVTPLKGRIAPADAMLREPDMWRFGFAFVARERGEGEASVRVRVVVCRGADCRPEERAVPFQIAVL